MPPPKKKDPRSYSPASMARRADPGKHLGTPGRSANLFTEALDAYDGEPDLNVDAYDQALRAQALPPPPPGYVYGPTGRLIPFISTHLGITSREGQAIFCEVLEITGSFRAACDALHIPGEHTVRSRMIKDVDFSDAVNTACDRHRQIFYAEAMQRATTGYLVPIIGGKEKDTIVAYEVRKSDTLLALFLKRHFVEFRDAAKASGATVNVTQNNTTNVKAELDFEKMPRVLRDRWRAIYADTEAQGLLPPPTPDPDTLGEDDPHTYVDAVSTDVIDPTDTDDSKDEN